MLPLLLNTSSSIVKVSFYLFTCHRSSKSQPHLRLTIGNAGNPLHRIPVFTTLLNAIPSLAILAPAPRSYWTSSGAARPTQAGLTTDYAAALAFAASRFPTSCLTIYGHSLGASIALCLLAAQKGIPNAAAVVHGLVLENPFTNVPEMLRVLYPQRWLPYHYLGAFVRDRWDARAAAASHTFPRDLARRAMVLVSERDEVVPPVMGQEIFGALRASGNTEERFGGGVGMKAPLGRLVVVDRALHEDAWCYREWTRAVKQYLEDLQKTVGRPGDCRSQHRFVDQPFVDL
jgi:uncharacterized protein